jgi:2,3-dihydroxybenzoate decarboxylase
MQSKIGLEEHFAIEETVGESLDFMPEVVWPELRRRLLDVQETRLRLMDAHGMELMLLSLNAPTVQAVPDAAKAEQLSRRANDFLAEQVARRPDRFQGLAAVPLQDPERAARELERCVKDLGFRGALVNGFSEVTNVDGPVITTFLNTAHSGQPWKCWTFPFICIRETRSLRMREYIKDIPGCLAQPGRSARKLQSTRCA